MFFTSTSTRFFRTGADFSLAGGCPQHPALGRMALVALDFQGFVKKGTPFFLC